MKKHQNEINSSLKTIKSCSLHIFFSLCMQHIQAACTDILSLNWKNDNATFTASEIQTMRKLKACVRYFLKIHYIYTWFNNFDKIAITNNVYLCSFFCLVLWEQFPCFSQSISWMPLYKVFLPVLIFNSHSHKTKTLCCHGWTFLYIYCFRLSKVSSFHREKFSIRNKLNDV